MKITNRQTVRLTTFPNLIYVRVHRQILRPYVGSTGSGAEVGRNSAVDIALSDIFGRLTGRPVCQLLGGASRNDIPV